MCTICGCGAAGHQHPHVHDPHDHTHHDHAHHHHHHARPAEHPPEAETAIVEPALHPSATDTRIIRLEVDLLGENNRLAGINRALFAARGILALNLVSSPGSGKTSLLVKTLQDLQGRHPMTVVEGDQQTSFDAERIHATGVQAVQINTGAMCHLDAQMVGDAVRRLDPADNGLVFIENVGNLVCPAGFDLGEAHKVVLLSVTEGDDKPLKYANMFAAADLMVLTKVDLLPHVQFDVDRCLRFARRVNPHIEILQTSATRGDGLDDWYAWIARVHSNAACHVLPASEVHA